MNSRNVIHDPAEEAALYVAGALLPAEVAAIEGRLASGSDDLAAEVASYDAVVLALTGESPPVIPDPRTKRALLDQLAPPAAVKRVRATQRSRVPRPSDTLFVRRAQSIDWRDYGIPGIQFCILHRDRSRNLQTCLVKAAAGAELPEHPHPVAEECYVLEGDFESHGTTLLAGDYMRAPAGLDHPASRTRSGCLLLVTSEIRDA
jgi:anti-sigma factor ChrR (cupin superfamily)